LELNVNSSSLIYRKEIQLRDGATAVIRPASLADRAKILAFYSRLSQTTIFLRYHQSKVTLNETDLENYCTFNYPEKLVLVTELGRGKKRIVGLGSYYRLCDYTTAETAFIVEDREQNRGIGTQLLRYLTILAMQNGIRYFVADVPRINTKMLSIYKKADALLTIENTGSSYAIKITLRSNPSY
jgi:hypothetical protein